jgi:hypothetical protein
MRCIVMIAWLAACERRKFESNLLGAWVYMGGLVVDVGFWLVAPYLGCG